MFQQMVHTTVLTDLITKKTPIHEYCLSMLSPHCSFSIIIFFALQNFNLLLSSNDPVTSHLKHPNQTPIPSAPIKRCKSRDNISLPTKHFSHQFSLDPLKEPMKYRKSASLFLLYRRDPERPSWLQLPGKLRAVLCLAPSHLSPNSSALPFSRLPQNTCYLYIPSLAFSIWQKMSNTEFCLWDNLGHICVVPKFSFLKSPKKIQ